VLAVLASDYPFLDIFWTMAIFFAWVIWIWLLILVLSDNFRRRDHSGFAKAMWTLFVIFLPLLGVLVYMISQPTEDPMLSRTAT
jgi:threonine/homoserine/homoserine lactone efflux protein